MTLGPRNNLESHGTHLCISRQRSPSVRRVSADDGRSTSIRVVLRKGVLTHRLRPTSERSDQKRTHRVGQSGGVVFQHSVRCAKLKRRADRSNHTQKQSLHLWRAAITTAAPRVSVCTEKHPPSDDPYLSAAALALRPVTTRSIRRLQPMPERTYWASCGPGAVASPARTPETGSPNRYSSCIIRVNIARRPR